MQPRDTRPQSTQQGEPLFPPLPPTSSLEVYDLRAASSENRLSIATLTGLINRTPARIYLVETNDDLFWLQEIASTLPRVNAPVSGDEALEHLLTLYRAQVAGLVIYDPALPDTINVATTLAGLRAGLAVSPAQAERFQQDFPTLIDLRSYGWKTSLQAYAWASEQLLPSCSDKLVAGLHPTISAGLRAFLVAQRVFICWLDARNIWPVPSLGWLSQRRLLKQILTSFSPGALHLGWFISEPFGVRLTSRAALLTLATDYCTNLEIWSNLPPQEDRATLTRNTPKQFPGEPDAPTTTYLSFTISDGDNLQYCQHRLLRLWNDPARGKLPLGWTISPALRRAMPPVAEFYRKTATPADEFIAGPSGAGYVYPSLLPRTERAMFLKRTGEYMQEMQLSILQVLDTGTLFSMKLLKRDLQQLFVTNLRKYGLRGLLSGWGSICPSWHLRTGLPVYQNLGMAMKRSQVLRLIQQASKRGTRFLNIYIYAWNITPGDLQEIVSQLGEGITLVTPGRLLELLAQQAETRPDQAAENQIIS